MLDEMIAYHRYTVEMLLFVMVMNLLLPFLLRTNLEKMVFWSRIGYFSFWAFWSMGIFTGLILFMFTGRKLTATVISMMIAALILGFLDGYRSIKSRKIWMSGIDAVGFSGMIVFAEISIVVIVAAVAILG